jgi:hypothetical protein
MYDILLAPILSEWSRIIYKNVDEEHAYESLQPIVKLSHFNKYMFWGLPVLKQSQPSLPETKELHTSK